MDTRSKNTNVKAFFKVVCVILSAAFAFSCAYCAFGAASAYYYHGDQLFGSSEDVFEETSRFQDELYRCVDVLKTLGEYSPQDDTAILLKYRKQVVDKIVNDYLAVKAQVIREELQWCVDNGSTSDEFSINQVRDILENTKGLDFLKYEDDVRADAFSERSFSYDLSTELQCLGVTLSLLSSTGRAVDLTCSKQELREEVVADYDMLVSFNSHGSNIQEELNRVEGLCNLKYYLKAKDGTVYTNMNDPKKELAALKEHKVWFIGTGKGFEQSGLSSCLSDAVSEPYSDDLLSAYGGLDVFLKDCKISFYFNDEYVLSDSFYRLHKGYESFPGKVFQPFLLGTAVSLLLSLVSLVLYLVLCGKRTAEGKLKPAFIDKLPTDLHLVLTAAAISGLFLLVWAVCEAIYDPYQYLTDNFGVKLPLAAASLLTALGWLLLMEWLGSTVRIKRAGQSYFKSFLGVRFILFVVKKLRAFFATLAYKPKSFTRLTLVMLVGAFLMEFILIFGLCFLLVHGGASILLPLIVIIPLLGLSTFIVWQLVSYVRNLDEIITAMSERRQPNVNYNSLPVSLKKLMDSLTLSRAELDRAIETALKDERMKTDLITNVSHDLKTPLTSVISYVDLLKRCEITDETAQNYIGVLEEKSARLKTLIDDLLEASKASSGNLTLNLAPLSLYELVCQAQGELGDDFEKAGLELIMTQPEQQVVIRADGQKTYRIIENLFSNARKYSVSGSRVYVNLWSDRSFGYMQVKNVSRDALNISPEELTERFVRGDKSRTDGGNGLGLAIAKDLCNLQGGGLYIEIDGDLFKATVALPLQM